MALVSSLIKCFDASGWVLTRGVYRYRCIFRVSGEAYFAFQNSYVRVTIRRIFAKAGYRIALIARDPEQLNKLASEINAAGGEAAAFPVKDYQYKSVIGVWDTIKGHKWSSPVEIRAALWNAGSAPFKKFLDVTEEDLELSLQTHITAAFAFSRQAILTFKENGLDAKGKRGTLLFTGATASLRGNVFTSAFATAKFGLRALSQSLAKEFGKENIHVCST